MNITDLYEEYFKNRLKPYHVKIKQINNILTFSGDSVSVTTSDDLEITTTTYEVVIPTFTDGVGFDSTNFDTETDTHGTPTTSDDTLEDGHFDWPVE